MRKIVDDVLEDKRESWQAAHELAHEWWGNAISAKGWQDFCLNEGLVQFIVAQFKRAQCGQDEYAREISLFKEYFTKHRFVVYSKGAFVFHMLKRHLGEELF